MMEGNAARLMFAIMALVVFVALAGGFLIKTTDPSDSSKQVPVMVALYDKAVIQYHTNSTTGTNRE